MIKKQIIVKNVINSTQCLDREQGQLIYNAILDNIKNGVLSEVDFQNIEATSSAFLSTAFASLINCKPAVNIVKSNIKVINMDNYTRKTLNKVMNIKLESIVQENVCSKCPYSTCSHHPK